MQLQGYFTKKGLALAAKLSAGADLTITRVAAGSGNTADPLSATALPNIVQTLAVNTAKIQGNTATIPVTLVAALAQKAYSVTELGVYAQDPNDGEILYKIYRLENAIDIRPDSRLVLRFYLEETISEDLGVQVLVSPSGLITEAELKPVREKANGLVESTAEFTVTADKLQNTLDSLPRCLNRTVLIHVSGTVDGRITVQNFYGNGLLAIRGTVGSDFCIRGSALFSDCACYTALGNVNIHQPSDAADDSAVSVIRCNNAVLQDVQIAGIQAGRGVSANASHVQMANVGISGFCTALLASYTSHVTMRNNNGGITYSQNHYGIYVWNGALVTLGNLVPETLGAATNLRQGGLIAAQDGTLL